MHNLDEWMRDASVKAMFSVCKQQDVNHHSYKSIAGELLKGFYKDNTECIKAKVIQKYEYDTVDELVKLINEEKTKKLLVITVLMVSACLFILLLLTMSTNKYSYIPMLFSSHILTLVLGYYMAESSYMSVLRKDLDCARQSLKIQRAYLEWVNDNKPAVNKMLGFDDTLYKRFKDGLAALLLA